MNDIIVITIFGLIIFIGGFLFLLKIFLRRKNFYDSLDFVFLRVLIPKKDSQDDDRKEVIKDMKEYIGIMEQFLTAIRSIYQDSFSASLFGQPRISLEFISFKQEIYFTLVVPKKIRILVEKQLLGFFSDAIVESVEEINIFSGIKSISIAEISLDRPFYFPITSYQKLEYDPMNALLGSMSKLSEDETASLQCILVPISDSWQEKAKKKGKKKKSKSHWYNVFSLLGSFVNFLFSQENDEKKKDSSDDAAEDGVEEKTKKSGFSVTLRVVACGRDSYTSDGIARNIFSSFSQYNHPGVNQFKAKFSLANNQSIQDYVFRRIPFQRISKKMILSVEEIASIFHFPHSKYNKVPEIRWQNFKIVKAPINIPQQGILLGTNTYRGVTKEVRIDNEDRFRHFYVIGQTGTGKSSILSVMARQDIREGKGLCVMDPHGDLANELLPFIPKNRADDIIYFDPSDLNRPMGINILEASSEDEKQLVVQDAMNIMIKLFGSEIFGPRIQDYFRNGALTLMDYPGGAAITDMVRLFTDENFQDDRRKTLKNPIVRAWWDYTYAKMGEREKSEMIPFFQAKFGGFITNTLMRNIVGQTKSSFDIYDVMQKGQIILINLSKGILGDFNSNLLGLMMVSKIQMAAMRRQSIDRAERKDFFLYIDEFQNYVTDSIESILSEARKYRLGLCIAHQYLGQLEKSDALTKSSVNLKNAIFGNVGTVLSYKIGPEDAEFLAKQFAPNFSDQDLINMDKFKAVGKIAIGGQPSPAFSITPSNPYLEQGNRKLANTYKEISRLKYGRDREFIEKEIIYRIGVL